LRYIPLDTQQDVPDESYWATNNQNKKPNTQLKHKKDKKLPKSKEIENYKTLVSSSLTTPGVETA